MSSLVTDFNELEKNYFEYKKSGIKLWPLVREDIFRKINQKVKSVKAPSTPDKNLSKTIKFKRLVGIIANTITYFFKAKPQVSYLILSHPRKKFMGGSYKDIYTDPILDEIENDYLVLERLFQLHHLSPSYQKKVLYADVLDFWPRVFSYIWDGNFKNEELQIWHKLEKEINNKFNVNVDVISVIKHEYVRAIINIWLLDRLLKKIKPKLILEVVGYGRLSKHINIVSKKHGIPTVELQHGFISNKHIAYKYPDVIRNIDAFPDYLSVWGEFWRENTRAPIPNENIIVNGFKFFNEQRDKQNESQDVKKNVLFISQGVIGEELSEIAIGLASRKDRHGFHILYKLHPGEYTDKEKKYRNLYEAENVTVCDSNSDDLYSLIAQSEFVVGVYSTALVEALGYNKRVKVCKLPGWEYMEDLINNNILDITVVSNIEELASELNAPSKTFSMNYNHDYIFSDYNIKMDTFIANSTG